MDHLLPSESLAILALDYEDRVASGPTYKTFTTIAKKLGGRKLLRIVDLYFPEILTVVGAVTAATIIYAIAKNWDKIEQKISSDRVKQFLRTLLYVATGILTVASIGAFVYFNQRRNVDIASFWSPTEYAQYSSWVRGQYEATGKSPGDIPTREVSDMSKVDRGGAVAHLRMLKIEIEDSAWKDFETSNREIVDSLTPDQKTELQRSVKAKAWKEFLENQDDPLKPGFLRRNRRMQATKRLKGLYAKSDATGTFLDPKRHQKAVEKREKAEQIRVENRAYTRREFDPKFKQIPQLVDDFVKVTQAIPAGRWTEALELFTHRPQVEASLQAGSFEEELEDFFKDFPETKPLFTRSKIFGTLSGTESVLFLSNFTYELEKKVTVYGMWNGVPKPEFTASFEKTTESDIHKEGKKVGRYRLPSRYRTFSKRKPTPRKSPKPKK